MLNNFSCMGRFTHAPELKTTPNGNNVVKFSLAVGRSKTTADSEKTADFIDCVAWNKTAEFIVKYFKKGEPIIIDGKLETRQYEDKQGIKRKIYEVVVREVNFCAFKKSDEQNLNLIEDLDGDLPF